ncbi:hypothetical protein [Cellulomonas sp. HZM]|uniref:hypothetical protein n=1 Tax=Cellulomonas sp. HZM TaxID=1454010 RepID=UPI0004931E2B|nr:hypothetical protein [Cellulomonas sp. HZM]
MTFRGADEPLVTSYPPVTDPRYDGAPQAAGLREAAARWRDADGDVQVPGELVLALEAVAQTARLGPSATFVQRAAAQAAAMSLDQAIDAPAAEGVPLLDVPPYAAATATGGQTFPLASGDASRTRTARSSLAWWRDRASAGSSIVSGCIGLVAAGVIATLDAAAELRAGIGGILLVGLAVISATSVVRGILRLRS